MTARSMTRCLGLVLLGGSATGCAALQEAAGLRTQMERVEWARASLVAAGTHGEVGEAEAEARVSPDATVRLPDGRTLAGWDELREYADSLGWLTGTLDPDVRVRFVRRCTGAYEELGSAEVGWTDRAGRERAATGHYAAVWEVVDGALVLREAALHPHRRPAGLCRTVADSTFRARSAWVSLHAEPASLFRDVPRQRVAAAMTAEGWQRGSDTFPGRAQLELVARVPVAGRVMASADVRALAGDVSGRTPADRSTQLHYTAVGGGIGLGARAGPNTLLAGPTALRIRGDWWDWRTPDEAWDAWTVGAAVEAARVFAVTTRIGAEARLHYRYLPALTIPGYQGSDPVRVSLSGAAVTLGLGTKLW